jgi:hypothetical protein
LLYCFVDLGDIIWFLGDPPRPWRIHNGWILRGLWCARVNRHI